MNWVIRMPISKFSEITKNFLGNYVYCLCSLINDERSLIYIGEGIEDRVFSHEKNNYSDMTAKGILISDILSQGGTIEKYILDCGMMNCKAVSGQDIAFHAENALINLAKLCNLPIANTQVGHGILKRAMLVDEVENLCLTDSIDFSVFDKDDRIMVYNYSFNSQKLFNSPSREENIKQDLLSWKIFFTNGTREAPKYICVVYRTIIQMFFSIEAELEEAFYECNPNKKYHKFAVKNIHTEGCEKYSYLIGKSLGDNIRINPKGVYQHLIYVYDEE